jgi:hypothetical protein
MRQCCLDGGPKESLRDDAVPLIKCCGLCDDVFS